jgi:BNR-Asp box repeat protein/BNR/Asp-box repeat protein
VEATVGERTVLLVGTRKGAFILESDAGRKKWSTRGPMCEGWPIHAMAIDPASRTVLAAGGSGWYGPAVWRSDDLGKTWTHSSAGLTYGDDGPKIETVWGVAQKNGTVYAGVEPAGLFRSDDGGATWSHVEGLTNHPTRPEWQPGGGGLCLHTIVPHPDDDNRVWVAISAVGTFETRDGGKTWETRNRGVRAGFLPPEEQYPEFGQCVHKLVLAADGGERLYQQNHSGVFTSSDGGRQWKDISPGLPSTFGFPMVAHPRETDTVWTVPLNGDDRGRYMPDGKAAVWRSDDAGATWVRHDQGLPQKDAYMTVLRDAMTVDRSDSVGVYFGTTGGELYGSSDEGRTWREIAAHLPAIWSVEAAVVG